MPPSIVSSGQDEVYFVDIESLSIRSVEGQQEGSEFGDDQNSSINNSQHYSYPDDCTEVADGALTTRESQCYSFSPIQILGGAVEQIFIMNILVYLDVNELCSIIATSKFFKRAGQSHVLWCTLYQRDFVVEESDALDSASVVSAQPLFGSLLTLPTAHLPLNKQSYVRRYLELKQRITRCKDKRINFRKEVLRSTRVATIENVLDLTQVRVLLPIVFISIFLSSVLFCQKVDGLQISYWSCFIPLLVALVYVIISLYVVRMIYKCQHNDLSLLGGLWNNFRGPLLYFFREMLGESLNLMYATVAILTLMVLQILLIATKLSSYSPDWLKRDLSWGVVFIPIWLLFGLYCVGPLLFYNGDYNPAYRASFTVVWIPMAIFFACLTVKLTGQDENSSDQDIRLAWILMPFWIIEGLALLCSLSFFLYGYQRYRAGLFEQFEQYFAVFVLCWSAVVPFVIFQALLCARDDFQTDHSSGNGSDGPTATETMSPILVVLGWLAISSAVFSFNAKTSFQIAREQSLHNFAGLRVICNF